MTMNSGPGPARPEFDPAAEPTSQPQPTAESQAAPASAEPAKTTAADVAGHAEGPEGKEKNKMFEMVRIKARLNMAEQELERTKAELEQLRQAPAEFQDKNIRLLAEMENLRRRTERERTDTAKFAVTKFARDVLTVADNFQRAVDTAPAEAKTASEGPLHSFYEGVVLTGRELLNVLERHGVKRIDPTGERFDPNVHQAMMQVDNAEVPTGTVMQTFQPAYMIEDRVLRPAMVVVSRGGPKIVKNLSEGAESGLDDMATGPVEPGASEASPATEAAAKPSDVNGTS